MKSRRASLALKKITFYMYRKSITHWASGGKTAVRKKRWAYRKGRSSLRFRPGGSNSLARWGVDLALGMSLKRVPPFRHRLRLRPSLALMKAPKANPVTETCGVNASFPTHAKKSVLKQIQCKWEHVQLRVTDRKRFGGGTGTAIGLVPSLSLFTNSTWMGTVWDFKCIWNCFFCKIWK